MDLIDRQQAIDAINELHDKPNAWLDLAVDALEMLPSAQPEPKIGYCVSQKGGGYCCSECGRYALDEVDGNFIHVAFKSNFCPHCGADMRGT